MRDNYPTTYLADAYRAAEIRERDELKQKLQTARLTIVRYRQQLADNGIKPRRYKEPKY